MTVGAELRNSPSPTALGSGSLEEGRRLPSGSQKAALSAQSDLLILQMTSGSDFLTLINPDFLISWQIELSFS